ncbi:hypothetical protein B484DRAFT_465681, partial [Ochromonadaceae sp. CCMP2298]
KVPVHEPSNSTGYSDSPAYSSNANSKYMSASGMVRKSKGVVPMGSAGTSTQRSKKNSQVEPNPALSRQQYDSGPSTGRSNASTSSGSTTVEDSPGSRSRGNSTGSGGVGGGALGRVSGLTMLGRSGMTTVEEGRGPIGGKEVGKPLCCDKCDGKHPTDDCPYYKKKRDDHPDAQKTKNIGGLSNLPAASLYKARVVQQPGDGNCLFHSMSYGLGSSNASKLRAEICSFIAQNPKMKICDTPLQDWDCISGIQRGDGVVIHRIKIRLRFISGKPSTNTLGQGVQLRSLLQALGILGDRIFRNWVILKEARPGTSLDSRCRDKERNIHDEVGHGGQQTKSGRLQERSERLKKALSEPQSPPEV